MILIVIQVLFPGLELGRFLAGAAWHRSWNISVPGYISGLKLNPFWPGPAGHRAPVNFEPCVSVHDGWFSKLYQLFIICNLSDIDMNLITSEYFPGFLFPKVRYLRYHLMFLFVNFHIKDLGKPSLKSLQNTQVSRVCKFYIGPMFSFQMKIVLHYTLNCL